MRKAESQLNGSGKKYKRCHGG
ncbi:MAG: SEC-C domain-containing protein [Candidatus Harrisonbacteria bacterium]|nr:SEC-C domain-containing protein [Candidatus Harrisonbacteria bacterium]